MPDEAYFGAVAEVNSAYLKSIKGLMKLFFPYNLVYSSNKASGNSSHYKGYSIIELSRSFCAYIIS
jgi:hypothetical protein